MALVSSGILQSSTMLCGCLWFRTRLLNTRKKILFIQNFAKDWFWLCFRSVWISRKNCKTAWSSVVARTALLLCFFVFPGNKIKMKQMKGRFSCTVKVSKHVEGAFYFVRSLLICKLLGNPVVNRDFTSSEVKLVKSVRIYSKKCQSVWSSVVACTTLLLCFFVSPGDLSVVKINDFLSCKRFRNFSVFSVLLFLAVAESCLGLVMSLLRLVAYVASFWLHSSEYVELERRCTKLFVLALFLGPS